MALLPHQSRSQPSFNPWLFYWPSCEREGAVQKHWTSDTLCKWCGLRRCHSPLPIFPLDTNSLLLVMLNKKGCEDVHSSRWNAIFKSCTWHLLCLDCMKIFQCWIFLATKVLFVIAQMEKIGALYCNQTTACYFCFSVICFLMRILHQLMCIFRVTCLMLQPLKICFYIK